MMTKEAPGSAAESAPALAVESLRFLYPGADRPAVGEISFTVGPGEIFGFLGPSGAGKSTTQNILVGLLAGHGGTVRVLGRDLASWGQDLYRRIGVAFESPNHYLRLTGRENLELFAGLYGGLTEDPDVVLERVGLLGDADKRVSELSKGMRGRLTLARALLHRPELLFLDEPTAGLDPVTARRIRDLIRETRDRGATVFLTTHDMVTADELCDRVAFLIQGRIAAVGEPRALRLAHGTRRVRVETRGATAGSAQEFPLEGLADNLAFIALLKTGQVETIHTQETTLEDVFVRVTGQALA